MYITGVPLTVPGVTFDVNCYTFTHTLKWKEPFNNFDPIVNYIVSCSGDVACPPNFTTTDNTTRSHIFITNLTPMTNYTFSVVATNSIGSGEAGVVMITPPGDNIITTTIIAAAATTTTTITTTTTTITTTTVHITTAAAAAATTVFIQCENMTTTATNATVTTSS